MSTLIFVKRIASRDWIAWTDGVPVRGEGISKSEAVGDLFFWLQDLDLTPIIEIHEVFDKPRLALVADVAKGGAA